MPCRYALGLRGRARSGAIHPLIAYEDWTTRAGFASVTTVPLSSNPPLTLMVRA